MVVLSTAAAMSDPQTPTLPPRAPHPAAPSNQSPQSCPQVSLPSWLPCEPIAGCQLCNTQDAGGARLHYHPSLQQQSDAARSAPFSSP